MTKRRCGRFVVEGVYVMSASRPLLTLGQSLAPGPVTLNAALNHSQHHGFRACTKSITRIQTRDSECLGGVWGVFEGCLKKV